MRNETKIRLNEMAEGRWIGLDEIKDGDELIPCCICDEIIQPNEYGWIYGNTAWPVDDDGRCCNSCDSDTIIPIRIAAMHHHE